MTKELPLAICLMGPTASGKSALALALAGRLPVEIVSVDASQVYRGLDIGTAKPTADERVRVAHHLIDIRDPAQSYSAAEFHDDALRVLPEVVARGSIPLLVGGTMFYFKALEFGLSALPRGDRGVRARLHHEAQEKGLAALHARLAARDPQSAARIHPNDPQRLLRALEIIELTGRSPTELAHEAPPQRAPYRLLKLAILPHDRHALHARIEGRFRAMLGAGLVAEVERLRARGDLSPDLPSMRTVGYRQVWEYLTGAVGYTEMVMRAVAATRQLAKRQLTWLRSYPGISALEMRQNPAVEECVEQLRRNPAWGGDFGL
jgi:tRNA dimethylallyltransferase